MNINKLIAQTIVASILDDLTDRCGLGDSWSEIDEDIQAEIVAKWEQIAESTVTEIRSAAPATV